MPLTAHNGTPLPSIMYGTAWKKEATTQLVEQALEAGFRAIDTANQLKHYDEARVGEALAAAFSRGVKRDELFLQTKFTSVDGQDHRLPYDKQADLATQVKQSVDSSLSHLHTDYLDSYVLHGPFSRYTLTQQDWEVWHAIEDAYKAGKVRVIGVSNFDVQQLKELLAKATVKPMVVQNRCYAIMGWDYEVRQVCTANGVIYQGFSLLTANSRELSRRAIRELAAQRNVTVPQLVFRFAQQMGMIPLTGTTNRQHMSEDLECDRFELLESEIEIIEQIAG